MSKLCVFGIGSPFGDDNLGFEVVKQLQQDADLKSLKPEKLHIQYLDRPGMHLLALMRNVNVVFLIDAVMTGASVGTLHRLENEEIHSAQSSFSTHSLGIAEVMSMGQALNDLPEKVVLFGIEIQEASCQFRLSKSVIKAINKLVTRIKTEILASVIVSPDESEARPSGRGAL